MGAVSMAEGMSRNQEADIWAAIVKAVEKGIMVKFPHVVQPIYWFDPCIGDLKCLVVLNKICKPEETDMQLVLQKAEIKIKDIESMSFLDVVKLQGELQAIPPKILWSRKLYICWKTTMLNDI